MPAWLLAIVTPIINKIVEKIGSMITSKIKESITESKRIKDLGNLKNNKQAKAAYIKSMLNK